MESTTYNIESYLNLKGCIEGCTNGFIKSRFDHCLVDLNISNDDYFNLLITLSEYSFPAILKSGEFNNCFNFDYSNNVNYNFIYKCLTNKLITKPFYNLQCRKHQLCDDQTIICFDCFERYRIVTRNLIPIIKCFRKDLCSIYFIDILYELIRYENRDVYSFITYVINNYYDGSSYKSFVLAFGKSKIKKLLKKLNRPFRQCDFKLILKKYIPIIYRVYAYSKGGDLDCLDKIYDYMLLNGLSVFKHIPYKYIIVGYKVHNKYKIDILECPEILDIANNSYKIATHDLLEGINFGFYKMRQIAYTNICDLNNKVKTEMRAKFANFKFNSKSVFSGRYISSSKCIVIGFLKPSDNTYQCFRLDIHIPSIICNLSKYDYLRKLNHDKWKFDDHEFDICYNN